MLKKILRVLFSILGLILGYLIGDAIIHTNYFVEFSSVKRMIFIAFSTLLFGSIMYLISPGVNRKIIRFMDYIIKNVQKLPATEILFGAIGGILGPVVVFPILSLLGRVPILGTLLAVVLAVLMSTIGANIAIKKREELVTLFISIKKGAIGTKDKKGKISRGEPKILDTSVIIDGRIFDICQTGFIEGSLIIPTFVLEELRHIADSSDSLKRNRGRRGLDILNKIQKELNIEVQIYEKDFPEIAEVDSKLLKLTQVLNGKIVTNDYNLNKVAEFQGVAVLNINELANAVKPVVLPGEEMTIQIIKDGKEAGQGIGYLDDGTMIVVEGGRRHIGEVKQVMVTSVLQTAAGKMIFAKQQEEI